MLRVISPQQDRLAQLATETIFEVVRFLPPRSMALLATLSTRLHDICTHVLYRDVHVDYHRTRRFILTILSHCPTSQKYPSLVRRITLIVRPSVTVCLGYSILSQSLLRMQNLETLGIFIPSSCSEFLVSTMTKIGLIQEKSNALTQKVAKDEPNFCYLPRLRELSLTGNNDLAKLCNSRSISTLRILEPMSGAELSELTNDLEPQGTRGIRCLDVRILSLKNRELFSVMARIDKAFPNITHFGLQAGYLNALMISHSLASRDDLFAGVTELRFNKNLNTEPSFTPSKKDCLSAQEEHIRLMGLSRKSLKAVQFGCMRWYRADFGSSWSVEEVLQPHTKFLKKNPLNEVDDCHVIYYAVNSLI